MIECNKIVGVGMSKTGTTTLSRCLSLIGVGPHKSYDKALKCRVENFGDVAKALEVAERYKSFEDSPWYSIYQEMDQRFPGSKFILTIRKNAETHAVSSWYHGVMAGARRGAPTAEYIAAKSEAYEKHNSAVLDYFRDRPNDLLVVCWEEGAGWTELCDFLDCGPPGVSFPAANVGSYRSKRRDLQPLGATAWTMIWRKARHAVASNSIIRSVRSWADPGRRPGIQELKNRGDDRK